MKIELYQISPEKDKNNLMYMNSDFVMKHGGIDYDSYELVFEGEVDAKRLDDIYRIFNLKHPEGYKGRNMSVSDIVYAEGLGTFFCDSIGFKAAYYPKNAKEIKTENRKSNSTTREEICYEKQTTVHI